MSEEPWGRFWEKVSPEPNTGCWLWTGTVGSKGYGRFRLAGRQVNAHRVAYELLRGKVPAETLDHLCLNKRCVNPNHLEPVSRGENARRYMLSRPGCVKGHPWTPENTRIDSKGRRSCLACAHARWLPPGEAWVKGRYRGGGGRPTKLTDADVLQIRALRGSATRAVLAARFNVSPSTIANIHSGHNRPVVTGEVTHVGR